MFKYFEYHTIMAALWRFISAVIDWRTHLRFITGRPLVDAVFVTNMRDEFDRKIYLGNLRPKCGHMNGPRYHINGVIGRTRSIDSVTGDLLNSQGRRRAKEQFIAAVKWAQDNGVSTILLAASTKRLFGDDGAKLKALFPELLFTIGDNGTMFLLMNETFRALEKAGLTPQNSKIGILGPYGFLGELMTKTLVSKGFKVVGAGSNVSGLQRMKGQYGIDVSESFDGVGKVDAVIACTHSEKIRLTCESIENIRKEGRKLLVVDVAEPSNLTEDEYRKCKSVVIRQDAGNGYSPNLRYVLGWISYRMMRLTRGVTFGCFAETLSLAAATKRNESVKQHDWFMVNDETMGIVSGLFQKVGFTIPSARCFGEPVKRFDLEMHPNLIGIDLSQLATNSQDTCLSEQ